MFNLVSRVEEEVQLSKRLSKPAIWALPNVSRPESNSQLTSSSQPHQAEKQMQVVQGFGIDFDKGTFSKSVYAVVFIVFLTYL